MADSTTHTSFDIAAFIRTNKAFFIWGTLFVLLGVLAYQGLMPVLVITFFLCYIFNNLSMTIAARSGMKRRTALFLVYAFFLAVIFAITSFVAPRLSGELTAFLSSVPRNIEAAQVFLDRLALDNPDLSTLIIKLKTMLSLESLAQTDVAQYVGMGFHFFNRITHYFSQFLLSTIFSFLVLWDLDGLACRIHTLRQTRLAEIYGTVSPAVVQFARIVGGAFQAQIMIAAANTVLTGLGLWVLGIHHIVLLSTIVFLCGLIPVLGTFISSTPITLLAFNSGGLLLAGAAIVMVIIVHAVENYFLNPRIFFHVFKISPILVILILFVGYNLFGLWGVLLGVPVSVFIYRHLMLHDPVEPDDLRPLTPEEEAERDACAVPPPLDPAPATDTKDTAANTAGKN